MRGMRKTRLFPLGCLLLTAVALANSGCLLAVAGVAAAGTAGYLLYDDGELVHRYDANLVDVQNATRAALIELRLPLINEKSSGRSATLTTRTAGETVEIQLDAHTPTSPAEGPVTRVGVRVGTWGDKAVSTAAFSTRSARTWFTPSRARARLACRFLSRPRSSPDAGPRRGALGPGWNHPGRRPATIASSAHRRTVTMPSPVVLAFDIGGANLKAAHTDGTVRSRPFPLWKNPDGLAGALRALVDGFAPFDRLAITMTGELCDCYETKRVGVEAILGAVATVAGGKTTGVWSVDGALVPLDVARRTPLAMAASNWLALATFAGGIMPVGLSILIDIGSTTADLIPLLDGIPVPLGRTDPARLSSGELVYTGVRRTPLCALLGAEGAAEFFATTQDVYLLLGKMRENLADCDTADGRPATCAAAGSGWHA